MLARVFLHAFHALLHSTHPSIARFSGDEEEEVGGAIHQPILGTKHTIMLVVNHTCLLASYFRVLDRFGRHSWPERSSVCWMHQLVRPTLDAAVASVQHPALPSLPCFALRSTMLCYCWFVCKSMLHVFLACPLMLCHAYLLVPCLLESSFHAISSFCYLPTLDTYVSRVQRWTLDYLAPNISVSCSLLPCLHLASF